MADLQHWRLEVDADGIAWCTLDVAGESANVLARAVLLELDLVLGELQQRAPRGAIICSGKDNGFIAGADVREFTKVEGAGAAAEIIREVHGIFGRLEGLPFPTLALISGFCVGGGLELALACRYRVAVDDPGTRLSFPEVMLGIFPGFGGSMRSIRLLGPLAALPLMLTGRSVDARRAARMGLVDRTVPARQQRAAARALLLGKVKVRRPRTWNRILSLGPVRRLVAAIMTRSVRGRVRRDHYPAPYVLLDHWRENGGSDRAMLDGEARHVGELLDTSTSRNLVRAFLLQERLKSFARSEAAPPTRVHVVGAGVMGGDIAAWCAVQDLQVTLQDREPRFIAPAIGRATQLFKGRLKQPRLVQAALDRLVPDPQGRGAAGADLVLEAIVENLAAKTELFRSLEPRLRPDALLATNTSSIALEELGAALARPERLVGIHFFNPVARMQLVEVVHGPATGAEWVQKACAFCRRINRLPLPVRSAPGFLINRILTPYLMETTLLLEEGVPAERIDAAAVEFGMPMGPVELADTVGLDVCLSVARNMSAVMTLNVPKRLEELVAAGRLGKKSGQGFYQWQGGRPRKAKTDGAPAGEDLRDRLVLRIVNECAACLREGIVEDADLVDAGMIFGAGFAPFRGGPMRYAADRGYEVVAARLSDLEQRFGERFRPDPWWQTVIDRRDDTAA